jgi:ABC-type uncharacterized transport system auxiliary subunit
MRPASLLPAVLVPLAALAAGCISVGGGEKPVDRRAWDLLPEADPAPAPVAEGPESLWVEPFTVDRALDREEVVWRRDAIETGAWEHHRWARPPQEALRALVAEAILRRGACAIVATEPRPLAADFHLRGHLARCDEEDAGDRWTGVLDLRVVLVRKSDGAEVLRRTYARVEPAAARNPRGVVDAIRAAAAAALRDLAGDVARVLEEERSGGAEAAPEPAEPDPGDPVPAGGGD